jgi:two-component system KDP operon response regulator KdpE
MEPGLRGTMAKRVKEQAMAGETVLIVEDDATLTNAVARNLAAHGYTTETTGTVAAALDALRAHTPDVMLLDIDLPDGSGWEVARALRAGGHAEVPVIVFSALRPNPRLVAELGCVGILEKPFPMASLLRLIGEYCGGSGTALATEADGG